MGTDETRHIGENETALTTSTRRPHPSRVLYRAGGVAALTAALLFRRYWSAEFLLLRSFGILVVGPTAPPSRAADWFALLQSHRVIGLILLDVVDLVNYALVGLTLLALYAALRDANGGATTVAATCGFIGIAVALVSNQAFAILSLSGRYAAATTETERSMLLAAGEALLAISRGTGYHLGLLLVTLSDLIVSLVMLRSGVFSRATAVVGLAAHLSQLGYFIALALAPALTAFPPAIAAPFRLVWYILVGRRLIRLARGIQQLDAR